MAANPAPFSPSLADPLKVKALDRRRVTVFEPGSNPNSNNGAITTLLPPTSPVLLNTPIAPTLLEVTTTRPTRTTAKPSFFQAEEEKAADSTSNIKQLEETMPLQFVHTGAFGDAAGDRHSPPPDAAVDSTKVVATKVRKASLAGSIIQPPTDPDTIVVEASKKLDLPDRIIYQQGYESADGFLFNKIRIELPVGGARRGDIPLSQIEELTVPFMNKLKAKRVEMENEKRRAKVLAMHQRRQAVKNHLSTSGSDLMNLSDDEGEEEDVDDEDPDLLTGTMHYAEMEYHSQQAALDVQDALLYRGALIGPQWLNLRRGRSDLENPFKEALKGTKVMKSVIKGHAKHQRLLAGQFSTDAVAQLQALGFQGVTAFDTSMTAIAESLQPVKKRKELETSSSSDDYDESEEEEEERGEVDPNDNQLPKKTKEGKKEETPEESHFRDFILWSCAQLSQQNVVVADAAVTTMFCPVADIGGDVSKQNSMNASSGDMTDSSTFGDAAHKNSLICARPVVLVGFRSNRTGFLSELAMWWKLNWTPRATAAAAATASTGSASTNVSSPSTPMPTPRTEAAAVSLPSVSVEMPVERPIPPVRLPKTLLKELQRSVTFVALHPVKGYVLLRCGQTEIVKNDVVDVQPKQPTDTSGEASGNVAEEQSPGAAAAASSAPQQSQGWFSWLWSWSAAASPPPPSQPTMDDATAAKTAARRKKQHTESFWKDLLSFRCVDCFSVMIMRNRTITKDLRYHYDFYWPSQFFVGQVVKTLMAPNGTPLFSPSSSSASSITAAGGSSGVTTNMPPTSTSFRGTMTSATNFMEKLLTEIGRCRWVPRLYVTSNGRTFDSKISADMDDATKEAVVAWEERMSTIMAPPKPPRRNSKKGQKQAQQELPPRYQYVAVQHYVSAVAIGQVYCPNPYGMTRAHRFTEPELPQELIPPQLRPSSPRTPRTAMPPATATKKTGTMTTSTGGAVIKPCEVVVQCKKYYAPLLSFGGGSHRSGPKAGGAAVAAGGGGVNGAASEKETSNGQLQLAGGNEDPAKREKTAQFVEEKSGTGEDPDACPTTAAAAVAAAPVKDTTSRYGGLSDYVQYAPHFSTIPLKPEEPWTAVNKPPMKIPSNKMPLSICLKIYGMMPGVRYELFRFDSPQDLPTEDQPTGVHAKRWQLPTITTKEAQKATSGIGVGGAKSAAIGTQMQEYAKIAMLKAKTESVSDAIQAIEDKLELAKQAKEAADIKAQEAKEEVAAADLQLREAKEAAQIAKKNLALGTTEKAATAKRPDHKEVVVSAQAKAEMDNATKAFEEAKERAMNAQSAYKKAEEQKWLQAEKFTTAIRVAEERKKYVMSFPGNAVVGKQKVEAAETVYRCIKEIASRYEEDARSAPSTSRLHHFALATSLLSHSAEKNFITQRREYKKSEEEAFVKVWNVEHEDWDEDTTWRMEPIAAGGGNEGPVGAKAIEAGYCLKDIDVVDFDETSTYFYRCLPVPVSAPQV